MANKGKFNRIWATLVISVDIDPPGDLEGLQERVVLYLEAYSVRPDYVPLGRTILLARLKRHPRWAPLLVDWPLPLTTVLVRVINWRCHQGRCLTKVALEQLAARRWLIGEVVVSVALEKLRVGGQLTTRFSRGLGHELHSPTCQFHSAWDEGLMAT